MNNLYETQRMMRKARKAAIQRGVIAVLDVGTSKIACFVLKFDTVKARDPQDPVGSMVGQADFKIIGASTIRSRGVKFGDIEIIRETERAIRTTVQAAQKMAGVRVDHVMACFSGGNPRSYGLSGTSVVQNGTVVESDIATVLSECEIPKYGSDRDVLHAQPVNFTLDHKNGLVDPRGQIGKKLSVDMHLLTVDSSSIEAILHCVKRCDLELAGLASSAYVSAISSMVEDEQEIGAACIEMGGGTTGMKYPYDAAADSNGDILVSQYNRDGVKKFVYDSASLDSGFGNNGISGKGNSTYEGSNQCRTSYSYSGEVYNDVYYTTAYYERAVVAINASTGKCIRKYYLGFYPYTVNVHVF